MADVCADPLGVNEARSVAGMNRDVVSQIAAAIDERHRQAEGGGGQPLMLLTAPRAGYGKTHLLGRVAAATGGQMSLVPLAFRLEDEIGFKAVGLRGSEALSRAAGSRAGWSRLRESCAGVCAVLLLRLIQGGRLPCANPDQAVRVLSADATDIFSEGGSAKLIGDWLRKHFAQLRKPMADTAAEMLGRPQSADFERWAQAVIAAASQGDSRSISTMRELASESREGCELWLRLMSLWRPVVLLADHLDGFYRDEAAGLRIAMLLLDLAEIEGSHVVLSLNQDVWQATFGHHLPSALEDRLTASQVLIRGLTADDAAELVRLRLREAAVSEDESAKFLKFLDVRRFFMGRPLGSVSARVFLRHAAQQWHVFAHSLDSGATFENEEPRAPDSLLPVIDEPSKKPQPASPTGEVTVFDRETGDYMKRVAEGLAEPVAALPQEGRQAPSSSPSASAVASIPTLGTAVTARSTGAFEKLREMLDKVRQSEAKADPSGNGGQASPATVADRLSRVVASQPATAAEVFSRDALLGRFEALRLQMAAEAESRNLDLGKLADLVRLAGKRFPLVHFSEIELPGNPGRPAARWQLQGAEIIFGLAEFADRRYWQTLAIYAAGRLIEIHEAAARSGEPVSQFKLLAFKSDRDTGVWNDMEKDAVFPPGLRDHVDALHLDTRSIASLYAMQRMIKEAEAGTIKAEPAQVMSVLARELDFFWKRITRPLAAR